MLLSCYWINAKMKRKKMLKQLPVERSLMIISEGANTSYHIIKQNYVFSVVSALALACTVQPYTMLPSSHGLSSQCLQGIFILLSVSLGFHIGFRQVLLAARLSDHSVQYALNYFALNTESLKIDSVRIIQLDLSLKNIVKKVVKMMCQKPLNADRDQIRKQGILRI